MSKINILYTPSKQAGVKAHLLAGIQLNQFNQAVAQIDPTSPAWDTAAELSEVQGNALVVAIGAEQDLVLAGESLTHALTAEKSRREAEKEKERADFLELCLSHEKAFSELTDHVPYGFCPVWNSRLDNWKRELNARPEVAARISEVRAIEKRIEEEKKQAEAEERARKEAARLAELAAEEAEREAFRIANEIPEKSIWFGVEQGCMTETPCWESHKRGKNWLAKVAKDPKSSGGLSRDFQEKCKGSFYYDVSGLSVGDYVEFGADYYSSRGSKDTTRWYGKITKIEPAFIAMEECEKLDVPA